MGDKKENKKYHIHTRPSGTSGGGMFVKEDTCNECGGKLIKIPQSYGECHGLILTEFICGCEQCNIRLYYSDYGMIEKYEKGEKLYPLNKNESENLNSAVGFQEGYIKDLQYPTIY